MNRHTYLNFFLVYVSIIELILTLYTDFLSAAYLPSLHMVWALETWKKRIQGCYYVVAECLFIHIVRFAPTQKNLTFLMAHKVLVQYVPWSIPCKSAEKQQGENHLLALILHL